MPTVALALSNFSLDCISFLHLKTYINKEGGDAIKDRFEQDLNKILKNEES